MSRLICWGVVLPFFTLTLLVQNAWADARLAYIFNDNMVLQQGVEVPVWGIATPEENIEISFAGQTLTTKADEKGEWEVKLKPMKASAEGLELIMKAKNTVALKNIVIGEVWICGGQSNMEWVVANSLDFGESQKKATPLVRHVKIDKLTSPVALRDFQKRQTWQVAAPNTVGGFSAIGYFFALKMSKELGVPIGLVGDNWGGVKIEAWIPPSGYRMVPELKKLNADMDKWFPEKGKASEVLPAHHDTPTALYNIMVSPLLKFPVKGVIFYHGESNWGENVTYYNKMRALIDGWRKERQQKKLPFVIAELTSYKPDINTPEGGDGWARQREAQELCWRTLDDVGVVITFDVGETDQIHPKNKQDVGDRFARWILAEYYGKDIVQSGPLYKSSTVEGNKMIIDFYFADSGLMAGKKTGYQPTEEVKNGELKRFAIAGKDKKWYWANAVIKGNKVEVSAPEVSNPVAVRYAFTMNPQGANLYNKAGLPAGPFRTDKW